MKDRRRGPPKASKEPAASSSHERQLGFHDQFYEDFDYWMRTDPRVALRLWRLMREIMRDPFEGIGKPEPLRHLNGAWSRRITGEHRITYRVYDDHIDFLGARYHYS